MASFLVKLPVCFCCSSLYHCSNMFALLFVVIVFLAVYKLYKFAYDKPPNTPPGIVRIPIGGSYWLLLWGNYDFPHKAIDYYVKKLKSKIISCYLGDYWTVIVNDYANIKEVLRREEFDGRITDVHFIKARAFGKKLGIFFIDGVQWQEQRRFALRNMRDFGFGRRQGNIEIEVMNEMSMLADILKHGPVYNEEKEIIKGNQVLFPDVLFAPAGNIIWNIMFGHRFDRDEHDIPRHLARSSMTFITAADTTGGAIFQLPSLRFFGNIFGYKNIMKGNYAIVDVIKKYMEYQKATLSDELDRGLVDRYLKKLKGNDKAHSFSEEQMIIMLVDMMLPSLALPPIAVTHAIKYLLHHPKVLQILQNEIDNVIGTGRLVTWEDRKHLPYMEATIRELFRIETLAPFGLIHRCVKDTTLAGYTIPENTPVITNLAAMHHDPAMWGDPENFRPERFLNENGELVKDMTLPFGFGHRICPGETYSRYYIFEILSVLLQNFNFFFVEGEPSSLEDKLPGLAVSPKKLWMRLELR